VLGGDGGEGSRALLLVESSVGKDRLFGCGGFQTSIGMVPPENSGWLTVGVGDDDSDNDVVVIDFLVLGRLLMLA
jgi:hypothetical protein